MHALRCCSLFRVWHTMCRSTLSSCVVALRMDITLSLTRLLYCFIFPRFGSWHEFMWPHARPNSDECNLEARMFVQSLDANMQGTHLAPVLEEVTHMEVRFPCCFCCCFLASITSLFASLGLMFCLCATLFTASSLCYSSSVCHHGWSCQEQELVFGYWFVVVHLSNPMTLTHTEFFALPSAQGSAHNSSLQCWHRRRRRYSLGCGVGAFS